MMRMLTWMTPRSAGRSSIFSTLTGPPAALPDAEGLRASVPNGRIAKDGASVSGLLAGAGVARDAASASRAASGITARGTAIGSKWVSTLTFETIEAERGTSGEESSPRCRRTGRMSGCSPGTRGNLTSSARTSGSADARSSIAACRTCRTGDGGGDTTVGPAGDIGNLGSAAGPAEVSCSSSRPALRFEPARPSAEPKSSAPSSACGSAPCRRSRSIVWRTMETATGPLTGPVPAATHRPCRSPRGPVIRPGAALRRPAPPCRRG